eukprot:TRINITY_DN112843_c0_g1_i1.p1 TRINITY_DN112843_c0_g1~~TRINITY_DN112843_c0_g1_i1.p1  ORF type:complete len:228 (+),score=50.93 TRINITY_DN112843_c0_g1_i1:107-790(+)
MGRDYYGLLAITRSATLAEVKEGYKNNAMKWHPQKNPNNKEAAEARFRDIAEAYDVLTEPLRRQRYDEVGEQGLKFPPQGIAEPYQYVGDPFTLFFNFFADADPLACAYDIDLISHAPATNPKAAEKAIEVQVPCTVADLQEGAQRRCVVERSRLTPAGAIYQESFPITLPVKAGWKAGTRITFPGQGNHTSTTTQPGDVIFVIAEQEFPRDPKPVQEKEVTIGMPS